MKRVLIVLVLCGPAWGGSLVVWPAEGNTPPEGNDFVDVASGAGHHLALKSEGIIVAWGSNHWGEGDVPEGTYIKIGGNLYCSAAISTEGRIVAWGGHAGFLDVPDGNDFIDISIRVAHGVGLQSDGNLATWNFPYACPSGNDFIGIAAGANHNLALRENGTIVAWGDNRYGQCDVPEGQYRVVAAAGAHSLAIRIDGSLAAWGSFYGEFPSGNDYTAITANKEWNAALKSDGSIVAWGSDYCNYLDVPDSNSFVALSIGDCEGIGLTSNTSYELTIQAEPNDMANLSPAKGIYSHYAGKRVYVNARRSPQCPDVYDFSYWSGDIPDPCEQSQYVVMDANKTITAHYIADERECGDECHPISELYDRNQDCRVDMVDFAIFAGEWGCTHPGCD